MMDCLYVVGLLFLAGEDWNGDRYLVNLDHIVSITQDMRPENFQPRTLITTTNGTIVENLEILDVAVGISYCEQFFYYDYEEESVE